MEGLAKVSAAMASNPPPLVLATSSASSEAPPTRRGLDLFAFQLNLSRFWHKMHPKLPRPPRNTSQTPPKQPLTAPLVTQDALKLSRKVDDYKPLPTCVSLKKICGTVSLSASWSMSARYGLVADSARHVKGCHSRQVAF